MLTLEGSVMDVKRVLIVDDSPTIRRLIRNRIVGDPRLLVVGEASDPYEAREQIKRLQPDVLTLDVEMPRMNGLEFLEKLMRLHPMPVVMISTETQRGSVVALEALSLGAVECVGKPNAERLHDTFLNLSELLVAAADANIRDHHKRIVAQPATGFEWNGRHVLIGASTGGVDALETLLSGYPENCPPTLITQHMPESFLASFAKRLDSRIAPNLALAEDGVPLMPGQVYLAPGGAFHLGVAPSDIPRCRLIEADKRNGHRPSVDVLFESALAMATGVVSVLLTGMGRDGSAAMKLLRQAGAHCLAQDQSTSVVFGMPRAALEIGAAECALPIGRMSDEILRLCTRSSSSLRGGN